MNPTPAPPTLDISIAVVCYNEERCIEKCLKSIGDQNWPAGRYELLIVDNGSTDGTVSMARNFTKTFPIPVRIIHNPHPGIAASRNVALRQARFDKVLFIDADCTAPRNWIKNYAQTWSDRFQNQAIAAAGGGNTAPQNGNRFQHSLGIMLNSVLGSRGSTQGLLFNKPKVIDHHPCLNLLLDRRPALEIGGFDEQAFNFMCEDQDLSLRLNARGYRYLFVPQNPVEHDLRHDWRGWARNMYDYGKGRACILDRHPHSRSFVFLAIRWFVPLMILSWGLGVITFTASRSFWGAFIWPPAFYMLFVALYSWRLCRKARRLDLWGDVTRNFILTHVFYSLGINRSVLGSRLATLKRSDRKMDHRSGQRTCLVSSPSSTG